MEEQQHYFLCTAAPGRIVLQQAECVDSRWVEPARLLTLGKVMELRRVARVLDLLGFSIELPAEEPR